MASAQISIGFLALLTSTWSQGMWSMTSPVFSGFAWIGVAFITSFTPVVHRPMLGHLVCVDEMALAVLVDHVARGF
jgi:hypothetical protein